MLPDNIKKRGATNRPQPKNSFRLKMNDKIRKAVFADSRTYSEIHSWLVEFGSGAIIFDTDWIYFSKEEIMLMFDLRWNS